MNIQKVPKRTISTYGNKVKW